MPQQSSTYTEDGPLPGLIWRYFHPTDVCNHRLSPSKQSRHNLKEENGPGTDGVSVCGRWVSVEAMVTGGSPRTDAAAAAFLRHGGEMEHGLW